MYQEAFIVKISVWEYQYLGYCNCSSHGCGRYPLSLPSPVWLSEFEHVGFGRKIYFLTTF